MDPLRVEWMPLRPTAEQQREKAVEAADKFEAVFVKSFIQSLRQTASIGEDSMFGSGPGADTYAGWFDNNVAEELSRTGGIGIAETLLRDMERHGQIVGEQPDDTDSPTALAQRAEQAAARTSLNTTITKNLGGLDVVL